MNDAVSKATNATGASTSSGRASPRNGIALTRAFSSFWGWASKSIRLTGIEPVEGQALLPFLLAHASWRNYTVGFGWKPGGFVIWDNRAPWHFAVNDYDGPRAYRKVIGD
jgi:Taurine catabolism dioxygenase TauD, TfdA family